MTERDLARAEQMPEGARTFATREFLANLLAASGITDVRPGLDDVAFDGGRRSVERLSVRGQPQGVTQDRGLVRGDGRSRFRTRRVRVESGE